MKIIIDPGHGGADSGAIGPSATCEKDLVLGVSQQLAAYLRWIDFDVALTRIEDVFISLEQRCAMAANFNADLFVSIHANAYHNPAARGFEVWTNPLLDAADEVAARIWHKFRTAFPLMVGRTDLSDGDPDKESKFYVLVHTPCPAVLVELGFISNPSEELRLISPSWRNRAVAAIGEAISEWR